MSEYFFNKKLILPIVIGFFLTYIIIEEYKSTQLDFFFFEKEIYKKPALEALSYYPELSNARIRFIDGGKSKLAHQAIPKTTSLIRSKKNRIFFIKIASEHSNELDSTLFINLDYESKVGVIGHELAHVLDYLDDSTLDLIVKGYNYQYDKLYRSKYELETNQIAIDRGLGEELLSWTNEVHEYLAKDKRGNLYHTPDELKKILKSQNFNKENN